MESGRGYTDPAADGFHQPIFRFEGQGKAQYGGRHHVNPQYMKRLYRQGIAGRSHIGRTRHSPPFVGRVNDELAQVVEDGATSSTAASMVAKLSS